jgi:hypothetical protein
VWGVLVGDVTVASFGMLCHPAKEDVMPVQIYDVRKYLASLCSNGVPTEQIQNVAAGQARIT